ncbi:MAG TPA: Maf family protein, partial [Rhizomicrobium sp.]
SASSTRQTMLNAAGVAFTVSPAGLNEAALMHDLIANGADAGTVAAALAEQKAVMVSRRNPHQIVLGGDSVLSLGSEILGKSHDLAALKALLLAMSGRNHALVSSAALARDGHVLWHHTARSRMTVRHLSETFIDAYLAREGEALLGSVGGYRFEGFGAQLFESVEGDYFSILGMPLLPVLGQLRALGLLEA